MVRLLVLSWAARGGGRSKALLSLSRYCSRGGIDVEVVTGERSWSPTRLAAHHDIDPAIVDAWRERNWRTGKTAAVEVAIDDTDPDVVIAFDTLLVKACRDVDVPVIGYLRTSTIAGVEEYWAPSRSVAEEHTDNLAAYGESRCLPVYPTWYIDKPSSDPPFDERPIDIMIHGRKCREAVTELNPDYDIMLANQLSYTDLRSLYQQVKLFVFPRPDRFEPLGLMPIEAAAHGCLLALPSNSGVAEIYPDHVYERPIDAVESILEQPPTTDRTPPVSPTDPVARIGALAG